MKKPIYFTFMAILLLGCTNSFNPWAEKKRTIKEKENLYKQKINKEFGIGSAENLHKMASDTLKSWLNFNLIQDTVYDKVNDYSFLSFYKLDPVICVNSSGDKLIGSVNHFNISENKMYMDGIQEFFGAKIHEKWYFWLGGGMAIFRDPVKNDPKLKPLTYDQLHKHAMENFLGGYLTKDGEINDKWFESKFKDGYIPFKQRYIYEHILDGQRIDSEKNYWNYQWKKAGLMNWIMKSSNDSIAEINNLSGEKLSRDQENEIRMAISRKMLAQ